MKALFLCSALPNSHMCNDSPEEPRVCAWHVIPFHLCGVVHGIYSSLFPWNMLPSPSGWHWDNLLTAFKCTVTVPLLENLRNCRAETRGMAALTLMRSLEKNLPFWTHKDWLALCCGRHSMQCFLSSYYVSGIQLDSRTVYGGHGNWGACVMAGWAPGRQGLWISPC